MTKQIQIPKMIGGEEHNLTVTYEKISGTRCNITEIKDASGNTLQNLWGNDLHNAIRSAERNDENKVI